MDDLLNNLRGLSVDEGAANRSCKFWTPEEQIKSKEKVKASGRETIVFDPVSDGPYETWQGFQPSKIKEKDCIKAVRVIKPGLTKAKVKPVSAEDLEKLMGEFKAKKAKGDINITPKYLVDLAVKYKFTTGNYRLFYSTCRGEFTIIIF
jgi:hypothetical protein